MVKINIVCVGNIKEKYLKEACAEYSKRLKAYCKLNIVEISEAKLPTNPSDRQITMAIEEEGENILKKLKNTYIIGLFIEGKQISSEDFAQALESIYTKKLSDITFVIGGSYGLSAKVKQACNEIISFSKMTFPHMLMRAFLLEQVYRAFQIINNGKYHK